MSDLVSTLRARIRAIRRRPSIDDPLECAVAAAIEFSRLERAWALVRLGASLRRSGRLDTALLVLDAAVAADGDAGTRRAAYTVAAALHCDRGEPRKALAVAEAEAANGVDNELLHVLVRAAWDVYRETRQPADRNRWLRHKDALDRLTAVPA